MKSPSTGTGQHVVAGIDRLVAAHRLHEVRALQGFTRDEPMNSDEPTGTTSSGPKKKELVTVSLGKPTDWLPAYEVFGEGIFVTLDEEKLSRWEKRDSVIVETQRLGAKAGALMGDLMGVATTNPRLYLLHTLAHVLIRQLSFDCGYPSASLRERLYVSERDGEIPMGGFLIYTADSDAEGSMGGLARQAEPENFALTLDRALSKSRWCSLDPVCSESRGGFNGANKSACHACCLVPETACELWNLHLTREFLVGSSTDLSFFD